MSSFRFSVGTRHRTSRFLNGANSASEERSVAVAKLKNEFQSPLIVAIPVHNEAEHIEKCLLALAQQEGACPFDVVALLNNCTDATSRIVDGLASRLPYRLHILEYWLDPSVRSAGIARRLAVRHAEILAGNEGIVLTTDADGVVATNWVATNVAAIAAGSDAVAGMAELDSEGAATVPLQLQIDEEKSEVFGTLLDEIDWLLDPDVSDPWPRHSQHSGASIAVRASWLARVGGIPAIPMGEDRQLFAQLRQFDARIRHSRDVVVSVSGRTVGRAKGGMADTIARRLREPDQWLDDNLEPALDHARRATLRTRAREAWSEQALGHSTSELANSLALPVATVRHALQATTFGRAWSDLERASPLLGWRAVPIGDLERETIMAGRIVEDIRATGRFNELIHRCDISSSASAPRHEAVAVPAE
jgi:glycosyltransferase involved in cell wall biosynthesis